MQRKKALEGYVTVEIRSIKSSLEEFYTVAEAYVEGDDPATTFASCGAVMLTAVLGETRSLEILAEITGLPVRFIEAVLLVMESGGHHFSPEFAELIIAVHTHKEDLKRMEYKLYALMENYWAGWMQFGVMLSKSFAEDISLVGGVSGGSTNMQRVPGSPRGSGSIEIMSLSTPHGPKKIRQCPAD